MYLRVYNKRPEHVCLCVEADVKLARKVVRRRIYWDFNF